MSDGVQIGVPARYQDVAEELAEALEADCVMLVVVGGNRGGGFCVAARSGKLPDLHTGPGVARYLKLLADGVEKQGGRGVHYRASKKRGN